MSSDVFHRNRNAKLALQLNVKLQADQKAVDSVVQRIMEVVRKIECAPGAEDAIELALAEALVNAVVHGAKNDPSKSVECDVMCDKKQGMLIIVRDPGEGFDPACVPNPLTGQNLYSNHGRGIFLINQLMDDVKFHKNGTEIHMTKKIRPVRPRKPRATRSAQAKRTPAKGKARKTR